MESSIRENIVNDVGLVNCGSYAYGVESHYYQGRKYTSISKWRKWGQDGKYHPDTSVVIKESDFVNSVLPALAKLYGKELI